MTDPTRQRDQPALTTSSGLIWLVVGGLLTAISLGVLIPLAGFDPPGVALVGIVVITALYIWMLMVRVVVRPGRLRLGMLAAGMIAIAAVALLAVLLVAQSVGSSTDTGLSGSGSISLGFSVLSGWVLMRPVHPRMTSVARGLTECEAGVAWVAPVRRPDARGGRAGWMA